MESPAHPGIPEAAQLSLLLCKSLRLAKSQWRETSPILCVNMQSREIMGGRDRYFPLHHHPPPSSFPSAKVRHALFFPAPWIFNLSISWTCQWERDFKKLIPGFRCVSAVSPPPAFPVSMLEPRGYRAQFLIISLILTHKSWVKLSKWSEETYMKKPVEGYGSVVFIIKNSNQNILFPFIHLLANVGW